MFPGHPAAIPLFTLLAAAAADVSAAAAEQSAAAAGGLRATFGDRGVEVRSGKTELHFGFRWQSRLNTRPGNLVTREGLRLERDRSLGLRRGRIEGAGTLFRPWWGVSAECDFTIRKCIDYRATFRLRDGLDIRLGQWKSEFNRERVDSSGEQQFAERSIVNYWFTIDRQRGISARARFGTGTRGDTTVWIAALGGEGFGGPIGTESGLGLLRVQWNPAGEVLPFSQSDVARRPSPLPSVAVAYAGGATPWTRFSTAGGGSLPGFAPGDYALEQWLFETALHYRGVSWQQELHFKRISDERLGAERNLVGGYAQLGSFVDTWLPAAPAALELALRFARVDPDDALPGDTQTEWTIGANWFFGGHRNKLTLDYSWLDFDGPNGGASGQRLRLQWDVSI